MARCMRAFFMPSAADLRAAGAARPLKAGFFGLIFLEFFGFFSVFFDCFFAFFTPAPVGNGRGLFKFLYF